MGNSCERQTEKEVIDKTEHVEGRKHQTQVMNLQGNQSLVTDKRKEIGFQKPNQTGEAERAAGGSPQAFVADSVPPSSRKAPSETAEQA